MTTNFNLDDQIWNLFRDWELEPEEKPEPCEYAKRYMTWCDEVCHKALESSSVIRLNQTRLKVANRYYEFYVSVPEEHKRCVGDGNHLCILSVFIEAMHRLKEHELRIDPPLLFLPPPPAPIQVVEVDGGISLGELVQATTKLST